MARPRSLTSAAAKSCWQHPAAAAKLLATQTSRPLPNAPSSIANTCILRDINTRGWEPPTSARLCHYPPLRRHKRNPPCPWNKRKTTRITKEEETPRPPPQLSKKKLAVTIKQKRKRMQRGTTRQYQHLRGTIRTRMQQQREKKQRQQAVLVVIPQL